MSDEFGPPNCAKCGYAHQPSLDCQRGQAHSSAPSGSPAPSWDNFCEHIRQVWPEMTPDTKDPKWTNLYTVYEIGYGACLLHMQQLIEQDNAPAHRPALERNDGKQD